jgi:hypothetical protein
METICIHGQESINVDNVKFRKMLLIFNAVNEGWCVKKKNDSYVFTKKHENKEEFFLDSYLSSFLKTNIDSDIHRLLG